MKIYCCKCGKEVESVHVTGKEIYPHRPDLYDLKFYMCSICKCYVGTHKKSGNPLGTIPSKEIKRLRIEIHNKYLDPLWKSGKFKRNDLYKELSQLVCKEYHTGEINDVYTANKVINYLKTKNEEDNV